MHIYWISDVWRFPDFQIESVLASFSASLLFSCPVRIVWRTACCLWRVVQYILLIVETACCLLRVVQSVLLSFWAFFSVQCECSRLLVVCCAIYTYVRKVYFGAFFFSCVFGLVACLFGPFWSVYLPNGNYIHGQARVVSYTRYLLIVFLEQRTEGHRPHRRFTGNQKAPHRYLQVNYARYMTTENFFPLFIASGMYEGPKDATPVKTNKLFSWREKLV